MLVLVRSNVNDNDFLLCGGAFRVAVVAVLHVAGEFDREGLISDD